MRKEYVTLILADVGDVPYLVQTTERARVGGFVEFFEGPALLLGRILQTVFVQLDGEEYRMFGELKPIFDAENLYECSWRRKED